MNKALEPKRLLFHLILGIIMIFILYRCSGDYTDVFEVGNEHYILIGKLCIKYVLKRIHLKNRRFLSGVYS